MSPAPSRTRRRPSRTLAGAIAGEMLKVFLLVFAILEVIHGTIFTVQAVRDYGFDLVLLFPIFWRTFAYAMYHAVPLAILFAAGLVFGRVVADREAAAMRSFGISHLEMLIAPAVIGIALAALGYIVNGHLVPEVRFARRNIGKIILDQLQYLGDGWNKSFQLGRENSMLIERYKSRKLHGIFIFVEDLEAMGLDKITEVAGSRPRRAKEAGGGSGGRKPAALEARSIPLIIHAEEGEVVAGAEGLNLELREVNIFFDEDLRRPGSSSEFLNRWYFSRVPIPLQLNDRRRGIKDMTNPMLEVELASRRDELRVLIERGGAAPEAIAKAEKRCLEIRSEYHRRLAFALISFTFPVAAALLALALNSTNRLLPFFAGVTVNCAIFFPLEVQGSRLAEAWGIPFLAQELGNLALLALALGLYLYLERRRPFRRRRGRPAAAGAHP